MNFYTFLSPPEDGKIVEVLAYFDETAENNEIAAYTASLEN